MRKFITIVEHEWKEPRFFLHDDPSDDDLDAPVAYGQNVLPDPSDERAFQTYYLYGGCQKFALVLHKLYGYPIVCLTKTPDRDADDDNAVEHVFCLVDSTAIDVRGHRDVDDMQREFGGALEEVDPDRQLRNVTFRETERKLIRDFIAAHPEKYRRG